MKFQKEALGVFGPAKVKKATMMPFPFIRYHQVQILAPLERENSLRARLSESTEDTQRTKHDQPSGQPLVQRPRTITLRLVFLAELKAVPSTAWSTQLNTMIRLWVEIAPEILWTFCWSSGSSLRSRELLICWEEFWSMADVDAP
jgi:hypothetical protein